MPARLRPVTKIYGLSFDFDGEKFHITPESQKAAVIVQRDMWSRYAHPKDQ
jgi:hypothetical protein